MLLCPVCGHENEDSASACSTCGKHLRGELIKPPPETQSADELEAMLDQLDLPEVFAS